MTEVSVATWNLHQAVDRRRGNIEAPRLNFEDPVTTWDEHLFANFSELSPR